MEKIWYFECFSGASGDMLMGALSGFLRDKRIYLDELKKISHIQNEFEVKISTVVKKGISATDADVILKKHEHHHRGLDHIKHIIENSDISQNAKNLATKIFTTLAEAEAKVHNTDINHVHFHEVGAIDAIVDIVGFSILFDILKIKKVIISPVNTGSGFVNAAHGILPVPAPATLEIIQKSGMPINTSINIESEALTPTGAAILATIKQEYGEWGKIPDFSQINEISYGAGKKDFEKIANVIRITCGNIEKQETTNIWQIETNIDDMNPEFFELAMDRLYEKGALEVFMTPTMMKKSRPATILSVLCEEKDLENIEKIIFENTTTFGIRRFKVERNILKRTFQKVNIPELGEITIKTGYDKDGNIVTSKPEYEDILRIAKEKNLSIKEVLKELKSSGI